MAQQEAPRYIPSKQEVRDDYNGNWSTNAEGVLGIVIARAGHLTTREKAVLAAVSDQSEDGVEVSYTDMERRMFGGDDD